MKKLILGLSILSLSCQAGFGDLIKGMSSSIAQVATKSCKAENAVLTITVAGVIGLVTWLIYDMSNHKKHADARQKYISDSMNNITKLAALETLTFNQKQDVYSFYCSVLEFQVRVQKLHVKKHAAYINKALSLIEQAEELLKKFDIDQLYHDIRPAYVQSQEIDQLLKQQQQLNNYYLMQQQKEKLHKQNIVNEKPGYCYNCEEWFTKQDNHSPKTCGK